MGTLSHLRQELDELASELEGLSAVPDALEQPEVARAQAVVGDARVALSTAFLSRKAMIAARESIARARILVGEAISRSRALREQAASLQADAVELRAAAGRARQRSADVADVPSEGRVPAVAGTVVIETSVPEDHPGRAEIELAITRTLAGAEGAWRVWITVPVGGTWWGLRVHGPSIEWVTTLQGTLEQTPEAIAARLEPLVRVARAEAQYRGHLGPRATPRRLHE